MLREKPMTSRQPVFSLTNFHAGVKLVYLLSYSPDLNPIEEFFAELKARIKRNWSYYEVDPDQGFDVFLGWCIDVVGAKEESARGHIRHEGLTVDSWILGF
jgi:transposase